MAYCLRSFVETLDQVLNPLTHYKKWVLDHDHRPQIQSLFENATFLQDFLDHSSPLIQERIASLEDQIMEAAQEASDTLETIITDQILLNPMDQKFTIIPPDLGQVMRVFEDAKQELSKIKEPSQSYDHIMLPSVSSTRYPLSKMVVGVEEDLNQLRSRLMSERRELDIIPIVGMGGIGKTTLARILHDEFSSNPHFDLCAWVTVSQSYDLKQILKTLLACVTEESKTEQSISEMITTLYQTLVGRRYLIVLDDIWSEKAWDDVKLAFAGDDNRSRIIFTTRGNSLAKYVESSSHEMHLVNDDKSWELLREKVFGKESCPTELEKVGKRIALKCGGLPLALQVIGGLLALSQRSKDYWEDVAYNVSSLITKTDDQFAGIFSWSFAHLPHYLKPCLLYMSAFPEDYNIPASSLIKLWIAEGFLYPVPGKSLEESAEIQLKSLVDRNLIFVRTWRWNMKAKSYGIHDLLRELCLRKAQDKKFLYFKDKNTRILQEDLSGFRRISVDSFYNFEPLKLTSFVRSILKHKKSDSGSCKSRCCYKSSLLRVLHSYRSEQNEIILPLVNLRYLTFEYIFDVFDVPAIIGISVLTNLQTLIVKRLESVAILEHLPQLRHLWFQSVKDEFEISRPHENLQYLSFLPVHLLTPLYGKLPNITKLRLDKNWEDSPSFLDLNCFQKLESLYLYCFQTYFSFKFNFNLSLTLPPSLKKLKIDCCIISQTLLNEIGILPRLQFLRLHRCGFENDTWEPIEGQFLQLQHLEISRTNLENWLADATHFPVLRHLVLKCCYYLSEIPYDIGEINTLETITLHRCKESVFDSARAILEKQLDFGNPLFKLQLGSTLKDDEYKLISYCDSFIRRDRLIIKGPIIYSTTVLQPYLRYLSLLDCRVSQTVLNAAGVLPELEDLTLERCYFEDSTWEPSEDQFRQLQNLEISKSQNLVKWSATENHFPALRKLVIRECHDLSEIPIGFGRIATLEVIVADFCNPSLDDSARIIEERRKLHNPLFELRWSVESSDTEELEEYGLSDTEALEEDGLSDTEALEEDGLSDTEALEEDVEKEFGNVTIQGSNSDSSNGKNRNSKRERMSANFKSQIRKGIRFLRKITHSKAR